MSKEVILMANVDGLGSEGEVVQVADGYARNYLLPQKLAAPVTEATRRKIEKRRKERTVQMAKDLEVAKKMVPQIEQLSLTIPVKTASEDKMFGSVTSADIARALEEQDIKIDRHKIGLEKPIRELGVFKVEIKLHPDVNARLKVWVVEE
jgi:large subunit ribosomal protein L9